MKRTTLSLDEGLLQQLKEIAVEQGTTLTAVANRLLRLALARPNQRPDYQLEFPTWSATVQPGVDLLDRDSLYDRFDGRR